MKTNPPLKTENATKSRNCIKRNSRRVVPCSAVYLDQVKFLFTTIFKIKGLLFNKPLWYLGAVGTPTVKILQPSPFKHAMTFLILFSSGKIILEELSLITMTFLCLKNNKIGEALIYNSDL